MNNLKCEACNYTTHRIYNFNKHLKTKKHLKNLNNISSAFYKYPPKSSEIPHNEFYVCHYCNKSFTRIDNLKRHINVRCKNNNEILKNKFIKQCELCILNKRH